MSSHFSRNSSSNDSLSAPSNVGNQYGKNLSGITASAKPVPTGARFHENNNNSPSLAKPEFRSMLLGIPSAEPSLVDRNAEGNDLKQKFGQVKTERKSDPLFLIVELMVVWVLPFLYPLEKANAKFPKESLPSVATRLKDLLRICSINVLSFSNGDESTTAFLKCQTMEQVEFVIVFWEVERDMYSAEIQRTSGDAQTFWVHARRLLDVMNGKQTTMPLDDPLYCNLEAARRSDAVASTIDKRVFLDKRFTVTAEDMKKAVGQLAELLGNNHYDSVGIVLGSLEPMTDPNMSGVDPSRAVAEIVLDPEGPIFWRLVDLIQRNEEPLLQCHPMKALQIFAKSIGLVGKANRERVSASSPQLMNMLRRCANQGNPHVAYCAVHILSYFISDGLVYDFELEPEMQDIGSTSHASLEKACWRLSNAMTNTDK